MSIGQEAAAVGQSVHLDTDDYIFGSHRSHGEIMAKCLSAISKLEDGKLSSIMEDFFDGATLNVVKDGSHENVKDLAEDFIIYGTLAEIFARETGINKGLGGSMHAFFIPFGSMPNKRTCWWLLRYLSGFGNEQVDQPQAGYRDCEHR